MNKESALFVDDYEEALCQRVEILEKRIFIETGEEELLVKVHSLDNGFPFKVSRKEFIKRSFFDKLTHHGLSVIEDDDSYAELRSSINESERKAHVVYYHERLGFREIGDVDKKTCFLGYHPIGPLLEPNELASTNIKERRLLQPQGNFNEWKSFVRKYVVPNIERTIALIFGATAPVSHVLKEECEFVDVPVWALINSSSTGKTTLLYLISSLYANPRYFIDTFNATTGALYAMLEERGAYPFLCDEATHTPNIDWDSMLYTLPTGKERRRCDNKGKLKPLVEFSGAVIMTSEISILDRSQGHGGQDCRIIEFELDPFKNEANLAEKMRNFCFQNYGWATEPLMQLLLDPVERAKLVRKYQKYFRSLKKRVSFEVTGVERRLLQRCALILASGWILRKAVQCNFDLLSLERYLLDHLAKKVEARDDRDEADKIFDKITGFVCINQDKFPTVSSLSPRNGSTYHSAFWGATGFYGTQACIWIEKGIFEDHILQNEMKTKTTTLHVLYNKGYIQKFYNKRYHLRKDFGHVSAQYYCILCPDTPNILKKIEDISLPNLSVAMLNARLAEDPIIKNYEFLNAERNLAYLTISHNYNQSYAIFASESFRKSMSMTSKSTLYATIITDEKLLLLSKDKINTNSIALHFEKESTGIIAKGISVLNLQDKIAINIPIKHQLVMTEISIEKYKNKPVAVINLNHQLLHIEPAENLPIDFTVKTFKNDGVGYRKVNSLLKDDLDENN